MQNGIMVLVYCESIICVVKLEMSQLSFTAEFHFKYLFIYLFSKN